MQKDILDQVAWWKYPGRLEKEYFPGVTEPGRLPGGTEKAGWWRQLGVVVLMAGGAADSGDCALDGFSEVEKYGAQHPQHLDCGL